MSCRTKRLTVIALAVLLAGTAFTTASAADREQYTEKFEKTLPMAPDGTLTLSNISGDIHISSWARSEAKIEAVKISWAATREEAQEKAAEVQIVVAQSGNGVRVKTDYPNHHDGNINVSVEYTVTVPPMASLDVTSVSGSITAAGSGGSAELKSVSGDVTASNIGGSSRVESVSGNVALNSVGGEGRCKSVSGDVTMSLVDGPVSAESVSGGIELVEPANAGLNLDASTFSGKIRSDFQMGASEFSHEHISADVNGGGKSVRLRTFSGSINLKQK